MLDARATASPSVRTRALAALARCSLAWAGLAAQALNRVSVGRLSEDSQSLLGLRKALRAIIKMRAGQVGDWQLYPRNSEVCVGKQTVAL
jgi:hypothetical protein